MLKSSEQIAEYVFLTNVRYTKMQNKTKKIFFKYLEENRTPEEFRKEINKIWDKVNHKFMDQQIKKLQKTINNQNVTQAVNIGRMYKEPKFKASGDWVIENEYFRLTPESEFIRFEHRYRDNVVKNYELNSRSMNNQSDKEAYLSSKIDTYNKNNNQVVTYFSKEGLPIRKVQLSTYLAMLHNVDLTRGAWNQTMADAERLGRDRFIIPYHPFCCTDCYYYMNRPLNKFEVEGIIEKTQYNEEEWEMMLNGRVNSIRGNLLHPNCKCTLDIFWSDIQIQSITLTEKDVNKYYKIRQKVNGLTLERSNLRTDMLIAKDMGEFEKVDKYKARISVINRNIRELRSELPTSSLQKQLTAINR